MNEIKNIKITDLISAPDNPFKVTMDSEMERLIESIAETGVIAPIIARPTDKGKYEIVSGHRRKFACEYLGIKSVPTIIKELDRNEAVIFLVDSNLQRENILPSEKAFAYKMKLDALSAQGKRTDLTSCQVGAVDKRSTRGEKYGKIRTYGGGEMQLKLHMVTIEDLVLEGHFLRKLDAVLDLGFVYEETAHLYSRGYGRPPIDPVVLVKYLLVGFLYGIPSERQIEQRIQTDVALRWYLGLDLFDRVPDHSTISQLRRRKPSFRKVFRRLFEEVVRQCIGKGLASGRLAATDSTHVKANASRASEELVEMPESPGSYWERLDAYEEEGLEELERRTGKRRQKRVRQIRKDNRRTKKRVSRTDPEAGHMKRPGKPEGQYYLSHQTVDADHGIILGVTVTPGDVHDSVPYLEHLEQIHKNVIPLQAATADSAYDFPLAHRVLEEQGIDFFVRPQSTHDRTQTELKRDAFPYDEAEDVYLCPNGKKLRARRLYRSASGLFWEYWADRKDCSGCPMREKCLSEMDRHGARKLTDSYFKPSVHRHMARREEPACREALKQRQVWCEGTFAIQKRMHNLTRLLRRGLEAAEDHCLLSATALNLKRMIWNMK